MPCSQFTLSLHSVLRSTLKLLIIAWIAGNAQAAFPPANELPSSDRLPSPFRCLDGSTVSSRSDWQGRREEIMALLQYYCYGHMPPAPGNVVATLVSSESALEGAAVEQRYLLSMGPEHAIEMNLRMLLPNKKGPFPAIVLNANHQDAHPPIEQELIERGYALVVYNRTDLDPDQNNQAGPAEKAYPEYDWGTLAMWAWGGMRTFDFLETLESIDSAKVVITGHSRGGKTALLVGAFDPRFALVVPNGSGCGGSGCFRILGPKSETLEVITDPERFSYWFHPRLRTFGGQVGRLPFDQHLLRALVAPRALLSTDALADYWSNPRGTQATYEAAQPVFDYLGVPDNNGQHFRPGKHDQLAEDWRALLDFADRVFHGKPTDRDFKQTPFPSATDAIDLETPPR
jgi:(4-O-methyl)-D-glucuronate---lignin esterase